MKLSREQEVEYYARTDEIKAATQKITTYASEVIREMSSGPNAKFREELSVVCVVDVLTNVVRQCLYAIVPSVGVHGTELLSRAACQSALGGHDATPPNYVRPGNGMVN